MKGIDMVVHAAAPKKVPAAEYSPIEAGGTSFDGATSVVDAAVDNNVERVVTMSTGEPVHPVNPYSAAKTVRDL